MSSQDSEPVSNECDLCDEPGVLTMTTVENVVTGEKRDADLCRDCHDKAIRYARGEDVDWSGVIDDGE